MTIASLSPLRAPAWAALGAALVTALSGCEPCLDDDCDGTVRVESIDEFVAENGAVTQLDTLPRQDGGFGFFVQSPTATVRYRGFRNDAGQFVVPNVVAPAHVVELDDVFYVTDGGSVNVGGRSLGRYDVSMTSPSVGLSFEARGLAPWSATDDLQFYSAGAGLYSYGIRQVSGVPTPGETLISGSLSYGQLESATPAVSASRGDVLHVAQMREGAVPGTSGGRGLVCERSVAMARVTNLEASSPGVLTAVFSTGTPSSVPLMYPGSQWRELVSGVHASATATSGFTYAEAAPEFTGPAGDLFNCSAPDAGLVDVQTNLPVVDGFPMNWQRRVVGGVGYRVSRTFMTEPAGTWTHSGSAATMNPVGSATPPSVFPPLALTIDGKPAMELAGVPAGRPITITWKPADRGTAPNAYFVSVFQYEISAGTASLQRVTRWYTNGGALTLPAGHLEEDLLGLITVRALDTTSPKTPWRSVTRGYADALSGPFPITK